MVALHHLNWKRADELLYEYQISMDSINSFDKWTVLHIIAASNDEATIKFCILEQAKEFINYQ
jgi:hypothetical protein